MARCRDVFLVVTTLCFSALLLLLLTAPCRGVCSLFPLPGCSTQWRKPHAAPSSWTKPRLHAKDLSTLSSHGRLLKVVTFWKDESTAASHEFIAYQQVRLEALKKNLKAPYGIEVDVVLVTNAHIPEVAGYVWKEVVQPFPQCKWNLQTGYCLPWEALRILCHEALGEGFQSRVSSAQDVLPLLQTHDYFMYAEEDMLLSQPAFEFWKEHADDALDRGYYLSPHRREIRDGNWVLTDNFKWGSIGCTRNSTAVVDSRSGNDLYYPSPKDSVYLIPGCPYAGMFVLTKRQFARWFHKGMWNFADASRVSRWPTREKATQGLLSFNRKNDSLAPGSYTPLTHMRVWAEHLCPSTVEFSAGELNLHQKGNFERVPVSDLAKVAATCEADRSECQQF